MGENESKIRLSNEQEQAIAMCCDTDDTIVSVTGGAGVGKTLVLGKVFWALRDLGRRVILCAPTGRAAKRIQEISGIPAKTIHRLLEFPLPGEDGTPGEPNRNLHNRLIEDVVIVDEASMLSPQLYQHLMNAIPKKGIVRFFGDNNQLPPVEEGKPPFIELLEDYPAITLSFNFRSDDEIVYNANLILKGKLPQMNNKFKIIYAQDPVMEMINWVPEEFARDSHQIICPTRKGRHGTGRINPSLQVRFNKRTDYLSLKRFEEKEAHLVLKPDDKWLWIKNDYNLNMFNGEIGKVDWVDTEDGSIGISTPERELTIPPRCRTYSPYHGTVIDYDPRKQIELGYAITTHKAQGSEFGMVLYCITSKQPFLLNRRNFYTAITRAKEQVIIIADRRAMMMSMRREQSFCR